MKKALLILFFFQFFVLKLFSQNLFNSTTFYCREYSFFSCWGGGCTEEYSVVELRQDSTFCFYELHRYFTSTDKGHKKTETKGRYFLQKDSILRFQTEEPTKNSNDSIKLEKNRINYFLNNGLALTKNSLTFNIYNRYDVFKKISFSDFLKIEADFFAHTFYLDSPKYDGLTIRLK